MKKIVLSVSLAVLMLNSNGNAAEEAKHIFKDGTVSGQVRMLYSGYDNRAAENQHATAIGGQLKFELAEFNGFNAAVEFTTSHDIGFATGDGVKQNSEISSKKGSYTELSQAYINYKNGG